jgi:phosphoglycolate phosphatase-like HAD superfamily hydrolase
VAALLARYLEVLADEVATSRGFRLNAGIERALAASEARGCAVGLGTGNVREGARLKLTRVGIFERFAFGGFGSDHEDRAELLRIGAERGARAVGAPREDCRVVVIGDTPKDIAAARAIGAEPFAVATGPFSVDALAPYGPGHLYVDLDADGALDALLA